MTAPLRHPPILASEALQEALRPLIPAEVRFALVTDPGRKPFAYDSLSDLARGIHARREGREIQLVNRANRLQRRPSPTPGVLIIARDPTAESTETLGWAFLAGGDWKALQGALQATEVSS